MTVETVRLGKLVRITGGGTPNRKNPSFWGGDISWASVKDLTNLELSKTKETISREGLEHSAAKLLPAGSIVVATRMAVGRCTITTIPIAINQDLKALKPSPGLDPRYLLWFLVRTGPLLERQAKGATVKGIKLESLEQMKIPLPPLPGQQRIAAILDKADAVRRKRQQTLDLADQFLRSAFLDMFGDPVTNPKGWPIKKLGDLVGGPVRNGLSPSRQGKHPGQVLTLAAITGSRFLPDCRKPALFDIAPRQDKMVDSRDFLICRGNGNIGLVGRARFPDASMPGVLFPDTMIGFRLDTSVVAKAYLQLAWETNAVRGQIMMKSRTTSGIHKVNQETLKTVSFPLPPIELQKKMEAIATKIRDIKQKGTSAAANSLCAALIQRTFRGELLQS